MKYGRFDQQGRVFFGRVEGDTVVELDGSPFDSFCVTTKRHTLASLRILLPCVPATSNAQNSQLTPHAITRPSASG